jgi:predicted deacetylase
MMPPLTGVSLFVSITIILVRGVYRGVCALFGADTASTSQQISVYRARPGLSLTIITAVFSVTLMVYGTVVYIAFGDPQNNYEFAQATLTPCTKTLHQRTDRNVILRLDDVQAYGWTDIAMLLMRDAYDRGYPTVAGVIPKNIHTQPELVRFLKQHGCMLEIAVHGWDHLPVTVSDRPGEEFGEFAFLDAAEATARIELALRALRSVSKTHPITFIPPHNQLSHASARVLEEYRIPLISSEGDGHFDYHAATWDFDRNSFVRARSVIADCEARFAQGHTLCVIMLHPQDFANADLALDPARYREYLTILEYIAETNISVMRFDTYVR